jgi:DNA-binding NtrC family response regulator
MREADLSTILQTPYVPTPAPDATWRLRVTAGADGASAPHVTLDGTTRVHVGQSPTCELQIRDPALSRRHASFEPVGARLRVTDLGSTNGTFVNGVAVMSAFLRGGETVQVGSTLLAVERGPAPQGVRLPERTHFGRVVGWSREMRRLYAVCERLAATNVPVIIEGETGTGKEALAEALHESSPRAAAPFVVFDCTAVAPSLVESELFGHERGAFTGATATRRGVFEQAQGGTLLIDEIGDLEASLQPKLLRVLERGEVRRVGGDRSIALDVRVLAATRRDLDHEVQAGRFRDDLFHRLAVARVELPALRERKGDVALLARHFAAQQQKQNGADPRLVTDEVLARWEDSPWPGNVRELRNAVARLLALGDLAGASGPERKRETMAPAAPASGKGDYLATVLAQKLPLPEARKRVADELERRYLEEVLAQNGNDVAAAAAASGIGRRYFNMLRSKLGT